MARVQGRKRERRPNAHTHASVRGEGYTGRNGRGQFSLAVWLQLDSEWPDHPKAIT